jgi:hypothetical protein
MTHIERDFEHYAYVLTHSLIAGQLVVTRRLIPARDLYDCYTPMERDGKLYSQQYSHDWKSYEPFWTPVDFATITTVHRQAEWKNDKTFETRGENRISARARLTPSRLLMRLTSFI